MRPLVCPLCPPLLLALLEAACPPGHSLQQPFPEAAAVHFCVAGAVEVTMPCGGSTAMGEAEYEAGVGAGVRVRVAGT